MITAEQLRVGNLLQTKHGKEVQVENIQSDGINSYTWSDIHYGIQSGGSDLSYEYEDLEPIRLNEQWLLDFGFTAESNYDNFKLDGLELSSSQRNISTNERSGFYLSLTENHILNSKVSFVHELQNLYYLLLEQDLFFNKIAEKN